jgi:multidrug efflux system outer membrane protein
VILALLATLAWGADVELLDGATWAAPASTAPAPAAPWWETLDPTLAALVDEGLAANGDAAAAWYAVQQSRALAAQAFSGLLPSVSADANITRQAAAGGIFDILGAALAAPTGATGTGFTGTGTGAPTAADVVESPSASTQANVQLGAQWVIDLFGRQALTYSASRHEAKAREGDREAAAMTLAFAIGTAWLDLCATEERLELAEQQLDAAESLLEVIELRYERGDATALDVFQQRQSIAASRTLVPQLSLGRDLARNQLATLLGRPSADGLPTPAALPVLREAPAVGEPADLVDHRPELRAAAERVTGARHSRSAAWLALAPTISANAALGQSGFWYGETDDPWNNTWSFGAAASLPLFQGGRTWAGIAAARAAARAAEASLDQAALNAKREVDDALTREARQGEIVAATNAQAEAALAAWESARDSYLAGSTPFVSVITAFSAHQQAEIGAVQARRDLLSARIQLHDAVGGPWTDSLPTPSGASR